MDQAKCSRTTLPSTRETARDTANTQKNTWPGFRSSASCDRKAWLQERLEAVARVFGVHALVPLSVRSPASSCRQALGGLASFQREIASSSPHAVRRRVLARSQLRSQFGPRFAEIRADGAPTWIDTWVSVIIVIIVRYYRFCSRLPLLLLFSSIILPRTRRRTRGGEAPCR